MKYLLILLLFAGTAYAGGNCGSPGPGPSASAGPPGGGPGYSNYRDWAKLVDGYGKKVNKPVQRHKRRSCNC